MRFLRSSWRILKVVALLLALAIHLLLRPARSATAGAEVVHLYCRRIVRALGISWQVDGPLPQYGAVVSNHLSYLDILLYSSIRPFIMVAKTEVSRWPGIGWLTKQAGTVYVMRGGGPSTYPGVNRAMAEAYHSGIPVLFFPEGTTTDGSEVLPFRRGLFHSVLNEEVPLQTATLSYAVNELEGSVANDVCWWGDATLAPHLARLASLPEVRAKVRFGGEIRQRDNRFILSETARECIAKIYEELSLPETRPATAMQESGLVEAF